MPRIDPVQLLKCLSVLLAPSGAIKSKDEVHRLASLMNKFSKKLVSKCIYLQILKRTDTELLGSFMGNGGWELVHIWLTDGIQTGNFPLIRELLELLLLCPVDVERLKLNTCPKLVMGLTKESSQPVIQFLAYKLRGQWLNLIKGGSAPPLTYEQLTDLISTECALVSCGLNLDDSKIYNSDAEDDCVKDKLEDTIDALTDADAPANVENGDVKSERTKNQIPILKITFKDGKKVVSNVTDKAEKKSESDKKHTDNLDKENKVKKKESDKHKSSSSSHSSSSKSSKSKHSSSDRRHSSESRHSNSDGSSHKSSSKSSSKDKDRRSSSSSSSSNSKDSERSKDKKHSDKDKSNSDKNKESSKTKDDKSKDGAKPPLSIMKLGKIPKKAAVPSEPEFKKEKPSISIEVRKPNDQNRPKTVKMFNSKFRSHGLEEEAKPPPPRGAVKKPTVPAPLPGLPIVPKRPSPIRSLEAPPEKKAKLIEPLPERPGSIKLIPPKPKPAYLLDGGSFMDALTASATNKKEPKKRKRKLSGSKEVKAGGESSPPGSPTSPNADDPKPAPPRFYQDTLENEDEEKKSKSDGVESPKEADDNLETSNAEQDEDSVNISSTGLRGVLCVHKRKGPKKTLRWRDSNLEEVQYFELDETERVNVTKPFQDMKQMEHSNEREAFKKVRNLPAEDYMEEKMIWRKLIPIDVDTAVMTDFGKNSKEKEIQQSRQVQILQAIYFHKSMIPDSPAEPDHESHPMSEPSSIPLDDVTGNPDSVNDFQGTPWPEPKANPQSPGFAPNPQMFQQMAPFAQPFNGAPYGPMAGYPPGMMPPTGDWPVGHPNAMMMGMPPQQPDMNQQEMYASGGYQQPPMGDYPMMDNGYHHGMNRSYGGGYQKNRGMGRGGGQQRGPWRSRGGGWGGPHRGGGSRGGRPCTHFQKKGYCSKGDSCPFAHGNPGGGHY